MAESITNDEAILNSSLTDNENGNDENQQHIINAGDSEVVDMNETINSGSEFAPGNNQNKSKKPTDTKTKWNDEEVCDNQPPISSRAMSYSFAFHCFTSPSPSSSSL
jgi:hypothetical protein